MLTRRWTDGRTDEQADVRTLYTHSPRHVCRGYNKGTTVIRIVTLETSGDGKDGGVVLGDK